MSDVIYGIHPVREALTARGHKLKEIWVSRGGQSRTVSEVLAQARELGIKIRSHERQRLDAKAGTTSHQGIVALISPSSFVDLDDILEAAQRDEPPLILVLDSIQDPQNLGSLIRSAYVCGAHGVVVPKDRAASLTPAVAKASAGALEHMDVARVTNVKRTLELFKKHGIWVVGLTMDADRFLYELDLCQPTALVIGGEAKGIRPLVRRTCDLLAAIPQHGRLDSFNAAAAGAMALYETMRQRLTVALQK